ncbi:MAG TPA: M48 family metalloprotease [Candidatus Saccharimonadales bacterium]|jgi:predicted Zn-dependent protease|nr:M48 family metalloprotease [Candidatus Saccharimonadales bacterium]
MRFTIKGPLFARYLFLVIAMLAVSIAPGPVAAAETPENFKFTKIDLELLEKVNQADKEFERKGLVFSEPEANAYLENIGAKLVPADLPENVKWRFRILRDSSPNAFALPNGSIYVHSGLLALLRNEAQMAAILGHEITHVVNRHGYLENRSQRKKMVAINILAAAGGVGGGFGGIGGVAASGILGGLVPSVVAATIFGYSRELERDADVYGLHAMARNNYPPIEMTAVFEILKTGYEVQLDKESRGLYADHPRLDDRIQYVNALLDSLPISGGPVVRAREYTKEMAPVLRHDVPLEILTGRARTALAVARRLTDLFPESAEDAFLQGEAHRALGGRTPSPRPEELTDSARGAVRKQLSKMTLQEYEKSLRSTPEGKAAWSANVTAAEAAYRRARTLDPQYAPAVRGLAALCDEDGRPAEAIAGYRQYLQMAPKALDAFRTRKRAEELEKASTAAPAQDHN